MLTEALSPKLISSRESSKGREGLASSRPATPDDDLLIVDEQDAQVAHVLGRLRLAVNHQGERLGVQTGALRQFPEAEPKRSRIRSCRRHSPQKRTFTEWRHWHFPPDEHRLPAPIRNEANSVHKNSISIHFAAMRSFRSAGLFHRVHSDRPACRHPRGLIRPTPAHAPFAM